MVNVSGPNSNAFGTVLIGLLTSVSWLAWRQFRESPGFDSLSPSTINTSSFTLPKKPNQKESYLFEAFVNTKPTESIPLQRYQQLFDTSDALVLVSDPSDSETHKSVQNAWNGVVQEAWQRAFAGRVASISIEAVLGIFVLCLFCS